MRTRQSQRWANAIAAVAALGILAACGSKTTPSSPSTGGGTNSGSSSNATGQGVAPGSAVFSQSPIDIGVISTIVPIGNLNPPDHTLPTNHAYFFHPSVANTEVRSPAAGTISIIQRGADDAIYVTVSPGFTFYFGHIRLDTGIAEGGKVTAGQRIGVTASAAAALDLGIINNAVTLFFVRPERYIAGTLHGDAPSKYFAEPVRSDLYAKVSRTGSDKDGRIDFDQTGRLAGNWFTTTLVPASETENFGNGSKHLAYVRDVNDPSLIRISIGGTLSISGAFYVQAGAPDPADVSPSSGKIAYQLFFMPQAQQPAGVMIVQMMADDRIQVETFPSGTPTTVSFTSAAVSYIR